MNSRTKSESVVIHSSIALLQERFRQLQRAKEMREEREFLRLLYEAQQVNRTTYNDPSRLFFRSELIDTPRPPVRGFFSLQHNLQSKHTDVQVTKTPILMNIRYTDTVMQKPDNLDDSDIDTSLHL